MLIKLLPLLLLAGCAGHAIPETVTLEGGTSVRHEVGESAVRQNTLLTRIQWRLTK